MRFIIPILCIVFLMGCGGGAKPPSWYGKDTQDSAYLIGFGSASKLESAKARAVNDISSQLSVQVSSQFKTQTQRQDSNITHKASSDIQLDVAAMELSDVQYTKSEFENGQHYVQAKILKSALISQFQNKFNNTYNTLNVVSLSKCKILSAKDKLRLENALNELWLYSQLLQTLEKQTRSLDNLESLLSANMPLPAAKLVIRSNVDSARIYNDLAKELGEFYTIQNDAAHTLYAEVRAIQSAKGVKIDVLFSILDCRNNPIFNTNVSEETNKGFEFATKRVSVQLYKKMQEWIEN